MKNPDNKQFTTKIYRKAKMVSQSRTGKRNRFTRNLSLISFTDLTTKVFVKVSYGMKKDYRGKLSEFTNEGTYDNKEDLLSAAIAFANET